MPTFNSIVSYTGDGVQTRWPFSFGGGYLDPSHIFVEIDEVLTQATLVDGEVEIDPAVTAGQSFRIVRKTPADAPLVDFTGGAAVTEDNLDTSTQQALMVSAEAQDTLNDVQERTLSVPKGEVAPALASLAGAADGDALGWVGGELAPVPHSGAAVTQAGNDILAEIEVQRTEIDADKAVVAADRVAVAIDRTAVAADRAAVAADKTSTALIKDETSAIRDDAEASRVGAETALAAALANSGVYTSTSAYETGAPVEGAYYFVVSASDDTIFELWHYTGGTSVDTGKRYTDASVLTNIGDVSDPAPAPYSFAVTDKDDNPTFGVKDGEVVVHKVTADYLQDLPVERIRKSLVKPITSKADINHLIVNGQSLSLGNGAYPLMSFAGTFYNSLRFNGNNVANVGPRAQEGGGTQAQNHGAFIPYAEETFPSSANGETVLGMAMRTAKNLMLSENGLDPNDDSYVFLGSAPGKSNANLSDLLASPTRDNFLNDVTYGASLAAAEGKTYRVAAELWLQGERPIADNTSYATYKANLAAYMAGNQAHYRAVTNRDIDTPVLSYQVMIGTTPTAAGGHGVTRAQTDFARETPWFHMIAPVYQFEHLALDNPHLTAAGTAEYGEILGLAYKRIVEDGAEWPMFEPVEAYRYGTIVDLVFPVHPDFGDLVLDDYCFAAVPNSGFDAVANSDGSANPIVSVEVRGGNRVRIVLANAVPSTVRYAYSTWGGNLRRKGLTKLDIRRDRERTLACFMFSKDVN